MTTIQPRESLTPPAGDGASLEITPEQVSVYQQEALERAALRDLSANRIASVIDVDNESLTGGVRVFRRRYTMDDGMVYAETTFYPRKGKQRSEVGIKESTPLGTGIKGHNSVNAARIARELGYVVQLAGPEGECHNHGWSPIKIGKRVISTSRLGYSAGNYLAIFNHSDRTNGTVVPGIDIGIGESRGADIQFAKLAADPRHGRITPYCDLTAAPYPDSKLSAKGLTEASMKSLGELMAVPRILYKLQKTLPPEVRKEYRTSTLHSGRYLLYAAGGTIPAILSGSGRYIDRMDHNQALFLRVFKHDGWGAADVWPVLFEDFPNVIVEPVEGKHLDMLDPDTHTFKNVLSRLADIRDICNDGSYRTANFRERMIRATPGLAQKLGSTAIPLQR